MHYSTDDANGTMKTLLEINYLFMLKCGKTTRSFEKDKKKKDKLCIKGLFFYFWKAS